MVLFLCNAFRFVDEVIHEQASSTEQSSAGAVMSDISSRAYSTWERRVGTHSGSSRHFEQGNESLQQESPGNDGARPASSNTNRHRNLKGLEEAGAIAGGASAEASTGARGSGSKRGEGGLLSRMSSISMMQSWPKTGGGRDALPYGAHHASKRMSAEMVHSHALSRHVGGTVSYVVRRCARGSACTVSLFIVVIRAYRETAVYYDLGILTGGTLLLKRRHVDN